MARRWLKREWHAVAVGLGLTLIAVIVHLSGLGTWRLEWLGYDELVRHFSRIPPSDRIVHVDIDDDALDRVGSWPWPRDLQGELIRILDELGAERIAMDIVWTEPRADEIRHPGLEPYADLEGEIEIVGELSEENIVYPDEELALAIAESGRVILGAFYQTGHREPTPVEVSLAAQLRDDFNLAPGDLANMTGHPLDEVNAVVAGVKRDVARELVHAYLCEHPDAKAREVHRAIIDRPFEDYTADRADILSAYHHELGLRELRGYLPEVPPQLQGRLPLVRRMEPPLYQLTHGAAGVGAVTFFPDPDGRTRHIPLMLEWDGRLIEQLGLITARQVLGISLDEVRVEDNGRAILLEHDDHPIARMQRNDEGQLLVNWTVPSDQWDECFTHLPATRMMQLHDCRKQHRENEIRRQIALARAIRHVVDDAGFDHYRRQYNRMLELERQLRLARLGQPAREIDLHQTQSEARQLRALVEQLQAQNLDLIHAGWEDLQSEGDLNDPEIADLYGRFKAAHRIVSEDLPRLEQANQRIEVSRRQLTEELARLVKGKICIVGYTATAVADMINSPPYPRAPGALVHSNVLNSILQNQFRTWTPRWGEALAVALAGVVTTLLAALRSPTRSLMWLLGGAVVVLGFNAGVVFYYWNHWLGLVTALITAFVVWAMIVLVRYLTTDRQKRFLRKAVAQYVSPAMARQIGESADRIDLSPVRGNVTCFFSDLEGFTTISERLGPEGTRSVLNPYLQVMSTTLHEHQALINKFWGDGIFAFFNPPILACPDHERAACDAALACQKSLDDLKQRHRDQPLADEFARLSMRIGISSGQVFVGDYGSENKLDYTCMGDTVNLAARLETANKQFGTTIMISDATRSRIGDTFVCRRLGLLQVKGKQASVAVYELLGRKDAIPDQTRMAAELFDEAVGAFARREWSRARQGFQDFLGLRASDPGARKYLEAIQLLEQEPPSEGWDGSLRLSEK